MLCEISLTSHVPRQPILANAKVVSTGGRQNEEKAIINVLFNFDGLLYALCFSKDFSFVAVSGHHLHDVWPEKGNHAASGEEKHKAEAWQFYLRQCLMVEPIGTVFRRKLVDDVGIVPERHHNC